MEHPARQYYNPDLTEAEERALLRRNYLVLQAGQAALGIVGPDLLGIAVEPRPDSVVLHFLVAASTAEVAEDIDDIVFELDALLGGGPEQHSAITTRVHVAEPDETWPSDAGVYRAKPRSTPAASKRTIEVPVSDWLLIDATLDNHVQSAIDHAVPDDVEDLSGVDTDEFAELPRVAQLGLSIRRAGWDQVPDWPHDLEGFKTWPAPGQLATLTLTTAQWNLVVFALRYWADVDDRTPDPDGAARSRAVATELEHRLAEQNR